MVESKGQILTKNPLELTAAFSLAVMFGIMLAGVTMFLFARPAFIAR